MTLEGKSGDKKTSEMDSEPVSKRQRIAVDGLEDDDDQLVPTPLFVDEPLRGPPPAPVIHAPIDDSGMRLKYSYGLNAWKQWVTAKNAELEASRAAGGASRPKLFKTEILHCSADELSLALSLFVKEVRKPTGQTYAADSIYYLCLGTSAHSVLMSCNVFDHISDMPAFMMLSLCNCHCKTLPSLSGGCSTVLAAPWLQTFGPKSVNMSHRSVAILTCYTTFTIHFSSITL